MDFKVVIVGSGMVGMSLAHQLLERNSNLDICIIEKEKEIGLHSSGRNSGVLHAGLYYEPNSLKAKVCISGSKRLQAWCKDNNVSINKCGKVIAPQRIDLDPQIDFLYERGIKNGANVKVIDQKEFYQLMPYGRTSSGRALWTPDTCVVNPKEVLKKLELVLVSKGVEFLKNIEIRNLDFNARRLFLSDGLSKRIITQINYDHLFNTAGLNADLLARKFGLGMKYNLLPFKGIYWKLNPKAPFKFDRNFYPVPDLNMPFLGVHFTPAIDGSINLGPTAIPALGRENYKGFKGFEPFLTLKFMNSLCNLLLSNNNDFRRYAKDQIFHGLKYFFIKEAQLLVPDLKSEHLQLSDKVGIRPQLYDTETFSLVKDFILENGPSSTHVLNAISPAFTASFALADLIIEKSSF